MSHSVMGEALARVVAVDADHARYSARRRNPYDTAHVAALIAEIDRMRGGGFVQRHERMEDMYRSGEFSLSEIGRACGVQAASVAQMALRRGWVRWART